MGTIAFLQALILDGYKRLAVLEKDRSFLKHCQLFSIRHVYDLED